MQTQDRISQLAEAPTPIHTGIVITLHGYLLDADCSYDFFGKTIAYFSRIHSTEFKV